MQVVSVALEDLVLAHAHVDVQVAGRGARRSRLALARQPDAVAAVDARRDLHRQGLGLFDPALAVAVGAGVGDDLAAAAAVRAALLHRENAALEAYLAATGTGAAGLHLAVGRAAAVAGG